MNWITLFLVMSAFGCEHPWVKQGEWTRDEIDAWREEKAALPKPEAQVVSHLEVSASPKKLNKAPEVAVGPPPKVDLNHSTMDELVTLPGVGPATAERIINYRTKRPFKKTSDLRRVKGIGPKTYQKLEPLVRVD